MHFFILMLGNNANAQLYESENQMTNTTTTKFIESMTNKGFNLAVKFINADDKAQQTKRETILSLASDYATNSEAVGYILEGFANAYSEAGYNANTVKQRKGEASAIFKAIALTPVTNDNLNSLVAFVGGFNAMVDSARGMLKAAADAKAKAFAPINQVTEPTAIAKVRPLTPLQLVTVTDSLKKANETELLDITSKATSELSRIHADKPVLAELSQFKLLANIANAMFENDKYDDATKNTANEIFKLANIAINRIESSNTVANTALVDVMQIPATM